MLSLKTFSTAILERAVELFSFVWEIPFALYEKYLLLSGRAGVYFHRGAVKSRQSASCWRQPILNATLLEKVFQIIWMNGVGVCLNGLEAQMNCISNIPAAELCRKQIFTKASRYSRCCAKATLATIRVKQGHCLTFSIPFSQQIKNNIIAIFFRPLQSPAKLNLILIHL